MAAGSHSHIRCRVPLKEKVDFLKQEERAARAFAALLLFSRIPKTPVRDGLAYVWQTAGRYNSDVSSELKRFLVLGLVALGASMALLLPISRVQSRIRPHNVPSTALFANSGKGRINWIDCQQRLSVDLQYCIVYTRDGRDLLVKGTFARSAVRTMASNIYYDGSVIHWKNGIVLEPRQLECVSGGTRSPDVPDCRTGKLP
jgi:hypothetical protein